MIDKAQAEEIAKYHLFPKEPGGEKREITKCDEHPFGWMFYYYVDPNLDGVNNSFIVERDGTVGHFGYKGHEKEHGLRVYEAFWKLRNDFAAAKELASQKKFEEAIAGLEKCLAKLNADPLLEGRRGSSENVTMTIEYLNALGNMQRQAKNLDAAEATLLKAKRILDDWSPVAQVGSLTQRLPVLESLMTLRKEQKKSVEQDRVKREMATAHRTQKEHSKAQELLEQVLQRRSENHSEAHPAVAETLTDLAFLKCDLAQFFEAQLFLDRAMKIWEPLLQNHDELKKHATGDFTVSEFMHAAAATMECYASNILMRQGKRDEATALRQRAKDFTSAGVT